MDNIIKKTMYIINKFQIKQTTNLLTNNYINIKFINNKLIIQNNPSNINILPILGDIFLKTFLLLKMTVSPSELFT